MATWYFLLLFYLFSVIYFNNEVKAECGRFIEEDSGTITSRLYSRLSPSEQRCFWEIKIPPNKTIWLYFRYLYLKEKGDCKSDYISLISKMNDGSAREHGKFCYRELFDRSFHFIDNNILAIELKAGRSIEQTYFAMDFFTVSDCRKFIESTNGTITSPLYPQNYSSFQICTWEIRMPPNKSIWLYFKHFHLEEGGVNCTCDYVSLKSKMEDGSVREHGKYCGQEIHGKSFHFNDSSILQIEFKSDHFNEDEGFELDFFTVPFECGEMLDGSEGIITSPRFPLPYPPDLDCTWNIQAPQNQNIKLTFTDFKTENSIECDQDYVTVQSKMAEGEIREYGKFCGGKTPPVIASESNLLQIQFRSRSNKGHEGFNATFISEGCGALNEGVKGNINSPFFPDPYPPNKICEWSFLVPPQHKLKLNFLHFEIEGGGDDCSNDFLLIQSKSAEGEVQELGKYCGKLDLSVSYSKDNILMTFTSDRSIQRKGFKAEYIIDKLTDYEMSTMFMKSLIPAFAPKSSTTENQNDIEIENASSINETNIVSEGGKVKNSFYTSMEEKKD